ncbi:MAG: HAMP domain-containing sensor histidine kinase [bacterium]|nr:HAMP domain-containing sensor histidine kinase [bacterium]
MVSRFKKINIVSQCREAKLSLWQCPPFLFVVMGFVNITMTVIVYIFAAQEVQQPEIAALIVIGISLLIFIIGNSLIAGFNKIAEANRLKSEFLNFVSHQLRTPLSVFKWTLELIIGKGNLDKETSNYVNILSEHTERMTQVVNLLLDVSRIDAGRLTFQRVSVSLEDLTNEVILALKTYTELNHVSITFEPKNKINVLGDATHLRMIIQNLIDNAIRYSLEAGTIVITTKNTDDKIEWKISDSGMGIPLGQQKYIFQKFYRAENSLRRQAQGLGLGLYIAQQVIKELDGTIGFESEEGKGSTFWFRLPTY